MIKEVVVTKHGGAVEINQIQLYINYIVNKSVHLVQYNMFSKEWGYTAAAGATT